jgi:quinol monooxygenase YgiN
MTRAATNALTWSAGSTTISRTRVYRKERSNPMTIYQTAYYQVKPDAVERVKAAIVELVGYLKENELTTRMYTAWQQDDDPTRFVHLFEFADEAAHEIHGSSEAVRKFESVYGPELVGGPVVFTDYRLVASKVAE